MRRFLLLLFLFLLLLIFSWWQLRQGITIGAIDVASVHIRQLEIRLDRRLDVNIDELRISGTSPHIDLDAWMTRIRACAGVLKDLRIRNLVYHGYSGSLFYHKNSFHLENDLVSLEGTLSFADGIFSFNLNKLRTKKYDLQVQGKGRYRHENGQLSFAGDMQGYGIRGRMEVKLQNRVVELGVRTEKFSSLKPLLARFPLEKDLQIWLTENIRAQSLQVKQLRLRFRISGGMPVLDPNSIDGVARLRDVDIFFHPDLAPVHSSGAILHWHHDRLDCDLLQPHYRNRSLAGSSVIINHLLQDVPSTLDIRLKTKTRLDQPVLDLLRAYDINLPFRQTEGYTSADLHLRLRLRDLDLKALGSFQTSASRWDWQGIPLACRRAEIRLHNSKISIRQAELSWQDNLQMDLTGNIDPDADLAHLEADIHHLLLQRDKTVLLQANNLRMSVDVDYASATKISLPQLAADIVMEDGTTSCTLHDLKLFKPLVPLLQAVPLTGGNLRLVSKDMQKFHFQGDISLTESLLLDHGQPVTHFRFRGTEDAGGTVLSANQGKITARIAEKIRIHLKDYSIRISEDSAASELNLPLPTHIAATGSTLLVRGFTIPALSFKADIDGRMVRVSATLPSGTIRMERTGDRFHLVGSGLDAELVQQLVNFMKLKGGRFNVSLWGKPDDFEGYIECSDVMVKDKDFVLLSNIMAFLDSIPALATFSSAGFNSDGYEIKKGIAHFRYRKETLTIIDSQSVGTSINTRAHGTIDFRHKTINLEMTLQTMKSLSKVIDSIPWVGYALLGKNNTMSTTLQIEGSLEHPEIKTHLSEQAVMAPLNILHRALTWPFQLFEKGDEKNGPPEKIDQTTDKEQGPEDPMDLY